MTTSTVATTPAPTGICKRCHRALRDPKSVAQERGPVCERKYQAALREAAKLTSDAQVDKAVALLDAAGVQPSGVDSFYVVTTQSGTYRTDRNLCTCPAGQNGRACYHRIAVCLVDVKAVKLAVPVS